MNTVRHSGDLDRTASLRRSRRLYWGAVAGSSDRWVISGEAYRHRLAEVYRSLIPAGRRVLDIGSAEGDLLATLRPSKGVGVDLSYEMVRRARARHPHLHFAQADAQDLPAGGSFDVITLSGLVNDLWDVQGVFEQVARVADPRARIILNFYSRVWQIPLEAARGLQLARPVPAQNWLTVEDVANLLRLAGLEMVRTWEEILLPVRLPLLEPLANRYLVRVPPFHLAALTHFVIARPAPVPTPPSIEPTVSVVIPARQEAGNIPALFDRTPSMGRSTELVFVEGHSTDGTYEAIENAIATHPERRAVLLRQSGQGKGDAVRLGFTHASGDVLMILDADMTVPPEDLPRFQDALCSGAGDFINGVRFVYPMEGEAMQFFNFIANKFFSLAFSWLLGQPVKDTLCGTKVLWNSDYRLIAANRKFFGDFDPFGDYDLLFGAAKLNLQITDLPVRYRERTYGTTNIQRWKHGLLLLRMVVFAARRIKFV